MEEIKKCPFCNGRAEIKSFTMRKFIKSITGYYVTCTVCKNRTSVQLSIKDTAERWNRRKNEV